MNGQLVNCTLESDRKQEQHTHNVLHPLYLHWTAMLEFLEPLMIVVGTQGEVNQKKKKAQPTTTAGALDMQGFD